MSDVVIKSRYMPSEKQKIIFEGLGRTKPEFKEMCDINHIMAKYQRTGVLPVVKDPGLYADYSNPVDYQTACNLMIRAQEQFEGIPANIRKRFNNDPEEFLSFCSDESNSKEMEKMGLKLRSELPESVVDGEEIQPDGEAV